MRRQTARALCVVEPIILHGGLQAFDGAAEGVLQLAMLADAEQAKLPRPQVN